MTIGEIRKELGTKTGDCLEVDLTVEDDGLREHIKVKGNDATLGFLLTELFSDLVNNPNYTLRTRKRILKTIRLVANGVKLEGDNDGK